jgi:hypothetical protein
MPKQQTAPRYLPQNFETHHDAVKRRRFDRKVLRGGGKRQRRVARRLRECQPRKRCRSEACRVCARTFRRQFLGAAAQVLASRPDWTRASVITSGLAIPCGQLRGVDLAKVVKHVRKRLERSPYLRSRIVIGGLDISLNLQNSVIQHWQLHLYLLIEGKKTRKLKQAIKTAFPPEPTAPRPYRFRVVKDFAAAASYAYKAMFQRRSRYFKNGAPRTRAFPLQGGDIRELLPFLSRHRVGGRLILRGIRRNGNPLTLQPSKPKPKPAQ